MILELVRSSEDISSQPEIFWDVICIFCSLFGGGGGPCCLGRFGVGGTGVAGPVLLVRCPACCRCRCCCFCFASVSRLSRRIAAFLEALRGWYELVPSSQ